MCGCGGMWHFIDDNRYAYVCMCVCVWCGNNNHFCHFSEDNHSSTMYVSMARSTFKLFVEIKETKTPISVDSYRPSSVLVFFSHKGNGNEENKQKHQLNLKQWLYLLKLKVMARYLTNGWKNVCLFLLFEGGMTISRGWTCLEWWCYC